MEDLLGYHKVRPSVGSVLTGNPLLASDVLYIIWQQFRLVFRPCLQAEVSAVEPVARVVFSHVSR